VGRDGIVARVNRECERLFGYSSSELIGQSVDLLLPDAARGESPWLRQAFDADSAGRLGGATRQWFARRKDGSEVAIEMALTPISVRGTGFVLASVIDVTVRHGQLRDRHSTSGSSSSKWWASSAPSSATSMRPTWTGASKTR
jgi:PAS domain S-box-containing protein